MNLIVLQILQGKAGFWFKALETNIKANQWAKMRLLCLCYASEQVPTIYLVIHIWILHNLLLYIALLKPGFQLYLKIVQSWARVWSMKALVGAPTAGGQFNTVPVPNTVQCFWAPKSQAASKQASRNCQSSGALKLATVFTGNIYDIGRRIPPHS